MKQFKGFFSVDMRQRAFAQVKTLFQYRLDQDRMKVDSGNRARGSQDNLNKRESPCLAIYKLFKTLTCVFSMALCSGEKLLAHTKWCILVFRPSMPQLVESFDLKATAVSDI